MTYATSDDFIQRFSEAELLDLADLDGDGVADASVLQSRINDTAAEINSYLGIRYAVPVLPVPDRIRDLACDILRYKLYGDAPTEHVRKRYEDALRYLRDVSAGNAALVGVAMVSNGGVGQVEMVSGGRVFERGHW